MKARAIIAMLLCLVVHPGCEQAAGTEVKNIIFMIGDGMGTGHISVLDASLQVQPGARSSAFRRLMNEHHAGLLDTGMYGAMTTDSAASVTQMACGVKSGAGMLGLDKDGYPCRTTMEAARALGKAAGLVTDTGVTHATPAGFVAKTADRDDEVNIAVQMLDSGVEVMLGGGAEVFLPGCAPSPGQGGAYRGQSGKSMLCGMRLSEVAECAGIASEVDGYGQRTDGRDLVTEARDRGRAIACTEDGLAGVTSGTLLGLFASSALPAYPERHRVAGVPSLQRMTQKAVELLEQDPDGFFLVVEAGQIDWGAHDNDGGQVLAAMHEADEALEYLMGYAAAHPDTLLIVTSDHETGGMSFAYMEAEDRIEELPSGVTHRVSYDYVDPALSFALLHEQRMSLGGLVNPIADELYTDGYEPNPEYPLSRGVAELVARVGEFSGYTLTEDQATEVLHVEPGTEIMPQAHAQELFYPGRAFAARLGQELVPQTRLVWSSGTHTSLPVPVMAMGPERFAARVRGYRHNTEIADILFAALGSSGP